MMSYEGRDFSWNLRIFRFINRYFLLSSRAINIEWEYIETCK